MPATRPRTAAAPRTASRAVRVSAVPAASRTGDTSANPGMAIAPMLAKVAEALPETGDFLFEPKWDGFRAIVFREAHGARLQSRDLKALDRYFPELQQALAEGLPAGCVLDGEIVIATPRGLDFDALLQRIHPAASRVARLAAETPAAFVAFDLLAVGGRSLQDRPQAERRAVLEQLLPAPQPPLYVTPMTRDLAVARRWLAQFEGAGLDGVVAKPADAPYQPGKRAMFKVKHARTADCVVAGFRWHKSMEAAAEEGAGEPVPAVGSLLLGLYDDAGVLQHAGVTSSFSMDMRRQLAAELEPLRRNALRNHPWRDWAGSANDELHRMPGARTRWNSGKDLAWEPLRIVRACEVRYDHLQGDRFRHATTFVRWRPDKAPRDCRYDQLEVATPYELARVFGQR